MNMFPEQTSCSDGLVMDYYDGNTVTALWNYAQNYALDDNFFGYDLRTINTWSTEPDIGHWRP